RKYKKMQEDKVNVQFFLDAETRAQLKELSRVRRLSTGEMLHDRKRRLSTVWQILKFLRE
ncbi:hypothetical protein FV302_27425, partial [Escherichia coli]